MVGDVLLGYYEIPEHLDEPLNTVVNPIGLQVHRVCKELATGFPSNPGGML